MASVSVRATSQHSRFWVIAATVLAVPVLALGLSQINLTVAIAAVAALIVVGVALVMIAARQFAVVAAMCIAVAIFVDWFPLLPYPFGGPGIPFAPIIALGFLGYIVLTTRASAFAVWPRHIWLWLALLVLAAPAILVGGILQESINYYGAVFVSPLVFLALGTVVAQNEGQFRQLLQCLAGLATLIAIHTLIQVFTGEFLFETPYIQKFLETYADFTLSGTDVSRAGSFLLNPDTAGAFFAVAAFLPLGLFASTRSRVARVVYGAEIVLILVALLETYAVGPILALCVGMLGYILLTMRGSRGIQVTVFVCLVATVLYVALPSQIDVLLAHATEPTEVTLRVAIWRTTFNMIRAYPLSGIGLGSSNYKALENIFRVSDQTAFEPEAHNSYLEVAVCAGILVGIIFILLVGSALKDAIDAVLKTSVRYRPLLAIVPSMCVALCVYSFVGSGWTCRPLTWMAWLLVGAVASPLLMNSLRNTASSDRHDSVPVDEFLDRVESGSWKWRKRQQKHRHVNASRPLSAHEFVRQPEISDPGFFVSQRPQNAFAAPRGPADEISEDVQIDMMSTAILPYVSVPETEPWQVSTGIQVGVSAPQRRSEDAGTPLVKLLKDSGVYAIASLVSPFISLGLAPFVTRNLSLADYGTLALITSAMALVQFLTQLGLGPAIVRAYNYEYTDDRNRRNLLGTAQLLILTVSAVMLAVVVISAQFLATTLLQRPLLGSVLIAAAVSIFLQNLSLPSMAWLLATSRRFTYVLLTILGSVVTLVATIIVVGQLQMGILGVIIAGAMANVAVVASLLPVVLTQAGWRLHLDLVQSLLLVGLPTIPTFVTGWILQLADRYILSLFVPSASLAVYSIGYTMGWILTSLIVSPFVSAWGTRLFSIAKMENRLSTFRQVFKGYSLFLLFAAFGLAMFVPFVLDLLFPPPYHEAASIAGIVAGASVFNGIYYVFHAGCQITKKLWLLPIYYGSSAAANVLLNLLLIPRLGLVGAALATLLGYGVLAVGAYIGNQFIYPVPFQVMRFALAALVGVALFGVVMWMLPMASVGWTLVVHIIATAFYGLVLLVIGLEDVRLLFQTPQVSWQVTLRKLRGEATSI